MITRNRWEKRAAKRGSLISKVSAAFRFMPIGGIWLGSVLLPRIDPPSLCGSRGDEAGLGFEVAAPQRPATDRVDHGWAIRSIRTAVGRPTHSLNKSPVSTDYIDRTSGSLLLAFNVPNEFDVSLTIMNARPAYALKRV